MIRSDGSEQSQKLDTMWLQISLEIHLTPSVRITLNQRRLKNKRIFIWCVVYENWCLGCEL